MVTIYQLPAILRLPHVIDDSIPSDTITDLIPSFNCLLYDDDVVLIADPSNLNTLLTKCEDHSYSLGYRWNPLNCVIVASTNDTQSYQLYDAELPKELSFSYIPWYFYKTRWSD